MSGSGIGLSNWLRLLKLGRRRLDSPQDYQTLGEFQGQLLVQYLNQKDVDLVGKMVLDLGSGLGGYEKALIKAGTHVLALDLTFAKEKNVADQICADATHVPLPKDTFDLVISISLIEHLPQHQKLIAEMVRLTKPGGLIYLSFPPFYSPVGGHHFSPWHLLGEKAAVWFFSKRKWHVNEKWTNEPYDFQSLSYKSAFGSFGLFPLKIRDVRRMIAESGTDIIDQSVKYLGINFSVLPIIGDCLTWQVQFLFRKSLIK